MTRKSLLGSASGFTRQGAAIVELAIVMPVLLLMVFGIIEFGQVAFVRHGLINAATQGARAASLPGATVASVRAVVDRAIEDGGLGGYEMNWGKEKTYVSADPPDLAETVTLSLPYSKVSLLGIFDEFLLSSTCTMFRGPLDRP